MSTCIYEKDGVYYSKKEYEERFKESYKKKKFIPPTEKFIQHKKNLLELYEERLNVIKNSKKFYSKDAEKLQLLNEQSKEINRLIYGVREGEEKKTYIVKNKKGKFVEKKYDDIGLKSELRILESGNDLKTIRFFVEPYLDRMKKLSKSEDINDIQEARFIGSFFKNLGNFSLQQEHPFFEKDQIFDKKGKNILPKEIIRDLNSYANRAKKLDDKIYKSERKILVKTINEEEALKKPLKEEEIFQDKKGLEDINKADTYLYDISTGISKGADIIAKFSFKLLTTIQKKYYALHNKFEKELKRISDDVKNEMGKLKGGKYLLSNLGILKTNGGVDYSLFWSKTKEGFFKDNLINRYKPEYYDLLNYLRKKYKRSLKTLTDKGNMSSFLNKFFNLQEEWDRKTTVINPTKIPEIFDDPYFKSFEQYFNKKDSERYVKELKSILGEVGYKDVIKELKENLKDFVTQRKIYEENLKEGEDVKKRMEFWDDLNNPFLYDGDRMKKIKSLKGTNRIKYYKKTKKLVIPSFKYYYVIPKDKEYYDPDYKIIENNKTLKNFYDLILNQIKELHNILPLEARERFSAHTIPSLKKDTIEMLLDSNQPLHRKVKKVLGVKVSEVKDSFTENPQNDMSQAKVDNETKLPTYKINSSFFKTNKKEIEQKYKVEKTRLAMAMQLEKPEKTNTLTTEDVYSLDDIGEEGLEILSENLGMSVDQIKENFGDKIKPAKLLRDGIIDSVVKSKSFDLPKLLIYYSKLGHELGASKEVLPILSLLKDHYEKIKNRKGDTRLETFRDNSIKKYDNWFKRVVLKSNVNQFEMGKFVVKKLEGEMSEKEKESYLASLLNLNSISDMTTADEKVLRKRIKLLKEKFEEESESKEEYDKKVEVLNAIEETLEKNFSVGKTMDTVFNLVRLKALAFNIPAQVKNLLIGMPTNFVIAANGTFFTPENIYRAAHIAKGSFLKSFGLTMIEGANKARILADRFDFLQDSSDDLQRTSIKTSFTKIRSFLNPYELNRRTEYLNQVTLMLALLFDQKITDKNGENEINVWDAMDEKGMLKEEYRTEENIDNWEEIKEKKYLKFSNKLDELISYAHGEYSKNKGNLASSYLAGKAFLMLKRFMTSVYRRYWGVEDFNLSAGVTTKGQIRSHTMASGMIHGGLVGMIALGPIGAVLGASSAGLISRFYGINSDINYFKDLVITIREIFMTMLRLPINFVAGKSVIREVKLGERELSQIDVNNLKSNIIEMALLAGWIGLTLLTKAIGWDDDDETDSSRRMLHNYFSNTFMGIASDTIFYVNAIDSMSVTEQIAFIGFLKDSAKTVDRTGEFLAGRDIIMTGIDAGESGLKKSLKKTFLPTIFRDGIFEGYFGFKAHAKKQFRKSPYDKWFYGKEKTAKDEVYRIRKKKTKELRESGVKNAIKELNKKYRIKKKNESYVRLLREYKRIR